MSKQCRICGLEGDHPRYQVREMMFGTREEFDYFQCAGCGCLQISEIPEDLGRYYPENYYSYRSFRKLADSRWRRLRYAGSRGPQGAYGKGWIGRVGNWFARPPKHLAWVEPAGIGVDSNILDVGCGNGKTLLKMSLGGFRNCEGIDPFIPQSLHYSNGVTVHKKGLQDFTKTTLKKFDLIMFHHSLEHMEDPLAMINAATAILSQEGRILVRVPVADSYAWGHYRENWIQIDAPRHLYLLTGKAMESLAQHAGLRIETVAYDSTKGQFVGSELYQRDIPGNATANDKKIFSRQQLREFKQKANELNREGRGDQAAFFLCRSSAG